MAMIMPNYHECWKLVCKGLKNWKLLVQKRKIVPNWPGYYCHLQRREESLTGILRPTSTSIYCNNIAMFYTGWVMLLKLLWLLKHLQCQKKNNYVHSYYFVSWHLVFFYQLADQGHQYREQACCNYFLIISSWSWYILIFDHVTSSSTL